MLQCLQRNVGGGAQESKKPSTSAPSVADRRQNDAKGATQGDARPSGVSASADVVEAALARAIDAEVQERRPGWEGRVAALAIELRTRRLARDGVAPLDVARIRQSRR